MFIINFKSWNWTQDTLNSVWDLNTLSIEDEDPGEEDKFEDNCKVYECIGSDRTVIVEKFLEEWKEEGE